jgi:toxin ParE1/3/4
MRFEVLLTAGAVRDLDELDDWIARHDSPARAAHVVDRIASAIAALSRFPERGARPRELLALGIGDYRETFFKPYRIVYRIERARVYVHLIADGRRDMQALLGRRLLRSVGSASAEAYSAKRIREFDAGEAALAKVLRRKK